MVTDKRYVCHVSGVTSDNRVASYDYQLRALDGNVANELALDIFRLTFGVSSNAKCELSLARVTKEDKDFVTHLYFNAFKELNARFSKSDYRDFLKLFSDFDGYDFVESVQGALACFEVNFQGFIFRVVFADNESKIDSSVITYKRSDGRKYIIENNWSRIFIG